LSDGGHVLGSSRLKAFAGTDASALAIARNIAAKIRFISSGTHYARDLTG
jgi:hypothetical protein